MRIGTIGTGFITSWFLSCWLEEQNECEAVYSRNYNNGKQLADKFNVEKIYTDLACFFSDDLIDIVYIASPNSLHYEHAKQALLANKHVIVEKPFTSTVEECEELLRLAQEAGRFIFEGSTTFSLPNVEIIQSLLPKIEPIRIMTCNMSKISRKYDEFLEGKKPNVFTTAYSGGALMDLNVYNIHLITTLFGEPKELTYYANIVDGIDISGCINMKYPKMVISSIAGKDSTARNSVTIQGEKGSIYIDSSAAVCASIELEMREQEAETFNMQNHTLTHIYYIRKMIKIIENENWLEWKRYSDHTLLVMGVIVQARESAGIIFGVER